MDLCKSSNIKKSLNASQHGQRLRSGGDGLHPHWRREWQFEICSYRGGRAQYCSVKGIKQKSRLTARFLQSMPFLQRSRKIVQQAKHPQDQPAAEHATQNARHYDAPHQKGAASFAQPHFFKLGFQFFLWNDLDQPIENRFKGDPCCLCVNQNVFLAYLFNARYFTRCGSIF